MKVYFFTCSYFRILYAVRCYTLEGFIDINSRKYSMIYTQSTHLISTTTLNDYTVPRFSCKVQFSDHVTYFPATMTQLFSNKEKERKKMRSCELIMRSLSC